MHSIAHWTGLLSTHACSSCDPCQKKESIMQQTHVKIDTQSRIQRSRSSPRFPPLPFKENYNRLSVKVKKGSKQSDQAVLTYDFSSGPLFLKRFSVFIIFHRCQWRTIWITHNYTPPLEPWFRPSAPAQFWLLQLSQMVGTSTTTPVWKFGLTSLVPRSVAEFFQCAESIGIWLLNPSDFCFTLSYYGVLYCLSFMVLFRIFQVRFQISNMVCFLALGITLRVLPLPLVLPLFFALLVLWPVRNK